MSHTLVANCCTALCFMELSTKRLPLAMISIYFLKIVLAVRCSEGDRKGVGSKEYVHVFAKRWACELQQTG